MNSLVIGPAILGVRIGPLQETNAKWPSLVSASKTAIILTVCFLLDSVSNLNPLGQTDMINIRKEHNWKLMQAYFSVALSISLPLLKSF